MGLFYISAWGDQPEAGIYTFHLHENGRPEKKAFVPLYHAGYLAWSQNKKFLYATCGIDDNSDGVAAFSVSADGSLKFLNKQKSFGNSCCHLCVSPDNRFVYAANYFTGNFSEFAILEDGSLSPALQTVQHRGSGPHPERQKSAHAHWTGFSPDGRFLLVVDLGLDAIVSYPYQPGKGIAAALPCRTVLSPGSGPRHLLFDRSGKIAYLITELGNTVQSLRYEEGTFQKISEVSTLPCRLDHPTKAGALRLSADERYLIASNRGFDSLAVFLLDGKGGMVLTDLQLSGGNSPRDMNFLSQNRFFVVGNEFSNNVYFCCFNTESGRLTPNGYKLELPRPLCFTE